jgi:hypothetical protein
MSRSSPRQKTDSILCTVVRGGKPRLIHFGDSHYAQFYDKLGHYSGQNHKDEKRREFVLQTARSSHGHECSQVVVTACAVVNIILVLVLLRQ